MLLWAINQDWAENLFLFGKAYLRQVVRATSDPSWPGPRKLLFFASPARSSPNGRRGRGRGGGIGDRDDDRGLVSVVAAAHVGLGIGRL
jgi:hypothetical protein